MFGINVQSVCVTQLHWLTDIVGVEWTGDVVAHVQWLVFWWKFYFKDTPLLFRGNKFSHCPKCFLTGLFIGPLSLVQVVFQQSRHGLISFPCLLIDLVDTVWVILFSLHHWTGWWFFLCAAPALSNSAFLIIQLYSPPHTECHHQHHHHHHRRKTETTECR